MSQLSHLCHQIKLPVPERSYIQLSHWTKGPRRIPQNITDLLSRLLVNLQSGGVALMQKTAFTYFIKHEEVELVHNYKLHHYLLASMVL